MSEEKIAPQILMIMSDSIPPFLGKNVRIRKARVIRDQGPSSWAMQGRVALHGARISSI